MEIESRLRTALERDAATVRHDVAAALREVRARDRRRGTRRRVAVGAVAGAILTVGVVAWFGGLGLDRGQVPAGPSRGDNHSDSASLTVMRERSAGSLGLRGLLRAAVAPDGRVYVTDSSQQVVELSPDLKVVQRWGVSGTGDGELRMIQGSLTVDDEGRVYVADTGNFRVQVFTGRGRYLRSIGEFGTGPGQFTWPFDLVVDHDGSLYVADDKEQTLTKMSANGRQVWRRGGPTETDPRLQGHIHMSMLDPRGGVLVVNDDKGVVSRVSRDGAVADNLAVESAPSRVCDATVDRAGRYYLTPCLGPWRVRIIAAGGTQIGVWGEAELAEAPRWTADGRGYAVTTDGGIVEVRAGVD